MSLNVKVWIPDDKAFAGRNVLEDPPRTDSSAGGESTRYQLWGSATTRRLGATLLPQLADITLQNRGNLQIPIDALDAFEQECTLLAENVEELAATTGYSADRILGLLSNMRLAVERARAVRGSILIW